MKKIVIATKNQGKLREMRQAFAHLPVEVVALDAFAEVPEPVEDGATFEENARIKAHAYALATHCACVADDSGLEVDELNGMPGVRSARWAGPACDDEDNNALLLAQLDGVPAERRTARFVCALAMVTTDGERLVWHGRMPGRIGDAPAGENGFGYDPLFIPAGLEVSAAELTPAEKDSISHRGIAVSAFVSYLAGLES